MNRIWTYIPPGTTKRSIGNDVQIGYQAVIMAGIRIGDGAIVEVVGVAGGQDTGTAAPSDERGAGEIVARPDKRREKKISRNRGCGSGISVNTDSS